MLDASSRVSNSANEGNRVASNGDVTLGVESEGVQIVISADGFSGCVRVRITVAPEA